MVNLNYINWIDGMLNSIAEKYLAWTSFNIEPYSEHTSEKVKFYKRIVIRVSGIDPFDISSEDKRDIPPDNSSIHYTSGPLSDSFLKDEDIYESIILLICRRFPDVTNDVWGLDQFHLNTAT